MLRLLVTYFFPTARAFILKPRIVFILCVSYVFAWRAPFQIPTVIIMFIPILVIYLRLLSWMPIPLISKGDETMNKGPRPASILFELNPFIRIQIVILLYEFILPQAPQTTAVRYPVKGKPFHLSPRPHAIERFYFCECHTLIMAD